MSLNVSWHSSHQLELQPSANAGIITAQLPQLTPIVGFWRQFPFSQSKKINCCVAIGIVKHVRDIYARQTEVSV